MARLTLALFATVGWMGLIGYVFIKLLWRLQGRPSAWRRKAAVASTRR